jgi:hypothetical protein
LRNFDSNHIISSSQQASMDMHNDAKFQTPKGPNLFHSNSLMAGSSSGAGERNLSTPDD